MKGSKRTLVLYSTFIMFIFTFLVIFRTSASANQDIDAVVTNTASLDSISQTESAPVTLTRKAPVSITNYSDIITESADTYDYSQKNSQTQTTDIPEATSAPSSDTPSTDNSGESNATTNDTTPITETNESQAGITNYVIIGDSRTVHMKATIGEQNHTWACKSSMGLKWMKSEAVPSVENKITKGTAVIILMGVNDLYNSKKYIEYINTKASEWASKGAKTYFVSVNPINEATYSGFKNTAIEEFNNKLKSGLQNVGYIDTYNYLKYTTIDFTKDGLHYNNKTSRDIYNKVMTTFVSTSSL